METERNKKGQFVKGNTSSPFKKGHKINVGKHMSETAKEKARKTRFLKRIIKNCTTCNKPFYVTPSRINTKACSKECIIKTTFKKGKTSWNKGKSGYKLAERPNTMPRGDKHWSWKGGISRDIHSLCKPEYREWRKSVFTRDNYKCRIADGNCKGQLQPHHILIWAEYPELRYVINNGITLCQAHHPRKRAEEKRLEPTFRELVSVLNAPQL